MAEKPKRKRRRVVSDESIRKDVSSEETWCNETCEEELFRFKNKRTSLEDLKEETLKQVQEELYEDCRHEDAGDEEDRRRWKRTEYSAWRVLDKQLNDARRNNPQDQQQGNKAQMEPQDDDDSDDDDYNYSAENLYVPMHDAIPSMPSSQALLNNVAMRLRSLRSNKVATPTGANDSIIDCTTLSPTHDAANYHITLRIRCKGRTHRYNTLTVKPFSEVVSQLADDLGVIKERILLSYKEDDVPLNATPDSLSLTTVDFLDALVLEKAITDEPVLAEDDKEQITVRVQSSDKTVSYRLCKADPLDKVLAAFSSAVDLPQEQIKFEFDGDTVLPNSTAESLGLEDDDIIDARITSN